ncbi:J domain-containing protein [Sphingobium nicotianae]|uniref:J domain-containing protein n=1 Tax=Sphingobium nicotianae TaxID=2782607 RepID=UPI0032D99240
MEGANRACSQEGCENVGEFRAPPEQRRGAPDGPPQWRWFCLDHIRAFNQQYNYFKDMSAEEIDAAQRPYGGWDRETRAFSANAAGGTMPPRWADFGDPLDAIGARFKARMAEAAERHDGKPLSGEDRSALRTLGLALDADRKALRTRYTELVRRFHPDHNGGDRAHEKALQDVLAAYAHLRKAPAFV